MATNRKRKPRSRAVLSVISPSLLHYFHTGERDKSLEGHQDTVWLTLCDREKLPDVWRQHSESILKDWIDRYPGTRPFIWWKLSAPGKRPEGETEAAYLQRHGLLTPAEIKHLGKGV